MKVVTGQGIVDAASGQLPSGATEPLPTKRHYDNFIDAYLKYTSGHEGSKKFHKWTALSIMAGVCERKLVLDHTYYKVYPNLYVLIVGPAGLVKKSTSTGIGMDLLNEIPSVRMMADSVSQAAMIDALQASKRSYKFEGQDYQQSAIFVYASEFKVLMNEVHGPIVELLTTFFDCVPYNHTVPWKKHTKGEGEVKIYGPCVNLLGCTTSAWLRDTIPVNQLEGGFASRILYVVENALPERFIAIPQYDPYLAGIKQKLINDLKVIAQYSGHFNMTEASKTFFTDWYVQHNLKIASKALVDKFTGYHGRKPMMALKLSMLLSINEGDSKLIELRHVDEAIKLLDDIASGMYDAFEASGSNPDSPLIARIFNMVKTNPGKCTQQLLFSHLWSYGGIDTLRNCIEMLRIMGAIVPHIKGQNTYYTAAPGINSLDDFQTQHQILAPQHPIEVAGSPTATPSGPEQAPVADDGTLEPSGNPDEL